MNKAPSHNHEVCTKCNIEFTTHKSGECKKCRLPGVSFVEKQRIKRVSSGNLLESYGEFTPSVEKTPNKGRLMLQKLRKKLNISEKELADKLGVHIRNIVALESGQQTIRPSKAKALGEFFGIDYKEFLI